MHSDTIGVTVYVALKKVIPGLLLEPSLIITLLHELGEGKRKCIYHIYKQISGKVASWISWEGWGLRVLKQICTGKEICCDFNLSGPTFILGGCHDPFHLQSRKYDLSDTVQRIFLKKVYIKAIPYA
jgi:hypothetical protein